MAISVMPLDEFDADMRAQVKEVEKGEAELTPELEELYKKLVFPMKTVKLAEVHKAEKKADRA